MQLPTEAQLAQRFAVNRHTVRRAIAVLASRGLLRTTQGRGTFVEQRPLPYPIGPRTRFSEIVSREGRSAGSELVEALAVACPAAVAAALRIGEGEPVLRLRTRRFIDGTPVSLGESYQPLPRFDGFAEAFRRHGAVTPAFAACGVGDYRRLETRISARTAGVAEAADLDLVPGRILLMVDSVNVDLAGLPIQATRALFAADRMELVVES
jgi:GntR family transcriptional regulator, phosphonate transport system regulatory protein